ncbi:MAG: Nif3-like dinuclear metal center hexameric protein [Bacteroidales bacterium]|nr:Nif3-like dinuclear metal center hexameric protein [Bacteroidales bacterium]
MTKIKALIHHFEELFPLSLQESYDNSGLLVGDSNSEITSVLISVDVTEDVVEEAINKKCNLIIAHHPIIFKGLKTLTGKTYVERTVVKAIKNDIAIYAAHTNLDVYEKGVSYQMAARLGLVDCKPILPTVEKLKKIVSFVPSTHLKQVQEALFKAGGGQIGNYDSCSYSSEGTGTFRGLDGAKPYVGELRTIHHEKETKLELVFPEYKEQIIVQELKKAHPYEEVAFDIIDINQYHPKIGLGKIGYLKEAVSVETFFSSLKKAFNIEHFRHSPLCKKTIQTVAVCGGSCSFLISKVRQKADILVTADIKYHEFFDAENQIIIADIGHYESEQFSKEIFYDIISKKFTNFVVHFSGINTNPINFI